MSKAGIPIGVTEEFVSGDKAKKIRSEGRADRQKVNKPKDRKSTRLNSSHT